MKKMYEIECEPACGFKVRSHNKNEVGKIAIEHVKNIHHSTVTKSEAEKMIKTA